jgi:S-DNA-T family DNA segregation ATPase FtsK/SpoIIIE
MLLIAGLGLLLGLTVNRWLLLLVLAAPVLGAVVHWHGQRLAEAAALRAQQETAAEQERSAAERAELLAQEQDELRAASLDPAGLQSAVQSGTDVWQGGPDVLLRLGTGDLPSLSVPDAVLPAVPVTVNLSAAGVLGIGGSGARGLARWLILQAAVQRGPAELSVWLLADPSRTGRDAEWGWLRSLPHNGGVPERSVRLVGTTDASLAARLAELQALIADRTAMATAPDAVRGPDLLVVLDGANAIRSLPGVPQLLSTGQSAGVLFLCIAELTGALPAECRVTASLTATGLELRAADAPAFELTPESLDPARADRIAAALPEATPTSPDPLPASVRLLETTGLESPTLSAIRDRWADGSSPVLGVGQAGPIALELRHGPVLLAGPTADETAELLRSAVTSLAITHAPQALSLVLVTETDALDGCRDLPHVAAVLREPDSPTTARALASLHAEITRRERLLASVAATDFEAYLAGGHRGLGRLVLVVDEVAALAPGLRDGLLTLAAQGAGAGVHLLVATSEPAKLPQDLVQQSGQRLVLRVPSAGDARRLLGSPAAAFVLESQRGRGYARVGEGPLVPFQAGTVDGSRPTLKTAPTAWDELGLPWPTGDPTGPSDLEQVLAALRDVERVESPWQDDLPGALLLTDLDATGAGLSRVPWALEDRPGEQAQGPATWDLESGGHLLVVGTRESGRSTVLRTLAASVATRCAPADVHLYALDGGDGPLAALDALPHCGAVVSTKEPERAERLLARLTAELARRQRQLADRGFADLKAQRAGTADPLPYLVLLVDAWERFVETHGWVDDGPLHDALADLLREGAAVGIRVVLSGDRSLLTSDLAALTSDRIALRLDDHEDYALAGLRPSAVPGQVRAGRGFRAAGDVVNALQVAVLPGDRAAAGQSAAVRELAAELPAARGRKPFRVDVLPARIGLDEALDLPLSGPGAPLAVGGDELRLQTVNLAACGPGFTIAGPAGSGRSTALLVLAQSLLEAGTQLCLLTPRPSPLQSLAEHEGVVLAADVRDPSRLASVLSHTNGRVAVLVDDADQLGDERWDEQLLEVLRHAVKKDHAVVVAGDQDWLAAADAGFAFEAQRSRSGLVLCPDGVERGDLLGVRLPTSAVATGPAGRGVLLRSGQLQAVQVPLPRH